MSFELHIDGTAIASEADFHQAVRLASGIQFYGNNLDALWDLLTGLVEPPVKISWDNTHLSRNILGNQFEKIVAVIREAQVELGFEQLTLELNP